MKMRVKSKNHKGGRTGDKMEVAMKGNIASKSSTEVLARPERRRFTNEYKLNFLEEVDRCNQPGQIGLLLRREGLYSSRISTWRQWRDRMKTGQPAGNRSAKDWHNENAKLQRENESLKKKLKKAEGLIELQKKVCEILGQSLTDDQNGNAS
jgi:transposase-like protein